jgi:hypothetical protein
MGQELECRLRYRRRTLAGKAYLETDHILFRGDERVRIALKEVKSAAVADGILTLECPGGRAAFELGAAAEKWAQKILHPPTRAAKLGIKPGLAVRLIGEFDAAFLEELAEAKIVKGKADLIFFLAADRADLARVARLAAELHRAGALWIVYPKGVQAIREIEVIQSGRAAGLKDTKVASFSPTHTALKFVVPLADR